MTDILPNVPGVTAASTGVVMNAPPGSLLAEMTKQVKDAVATLPPGSRGALVGVATTKGVNLAVVSKAGNHVSVVGWIGKSWGSAIDGGAAVQVHW